MRLIVTAAVCGLMLLPGSASAARGMEVAIQDDLTLLERGGFYGEFIDQDLVYRRMRGVQASRIRINVLWAYAVVPEQRDLRRTPKRVRYRWDLYDSAITRAKRRGMKVLLSLTGPAPAWATPKRNVEKGHYKPNPYKFREFVKAFARRYRKKVDRYSIWNEPNWYTWLAPHKQSPLLYRKLYRQAYKAISKQHRKARVLLGELAPYHRRSKAIAPLEFLRQMTCLGDGYRKKRRLWKRKCGKLKLYADGIAHHPYDFKRPPWKKRPGRDNVTIASLGRMTSALDTMKRRRVLMPRRTKRMPLFLTEWGYHRSGYRRIPERRRAYWTKKGFEVARKHPRVKMMLQYTFVQPPGGSWFDLSLIDTDGDKTRTWRKLRGWAKYHAKRKNIKRPGRWRA
jgi:hypothetical protein